MPHNEFRGDGTVTFTEVPLSTSVATRLVDTPGAPPGATAALIQVQGSTCRIRVDGGAPTKTSGHRVLADDTIELGFGCLTNARMIADGGAPPVLAIHWLP